MWNIRFALLLFLSVVASLPICRGQSLSASKGSTIKKKSEQPPPNGHLVPLRSIVAATEIAATFDQPLTCDSDGNLYLQSEHFGVSGIRKLNAKGDRVALFQPNANPDLKVDTVGYFTLSPSGDLYELVFPHEITNYVLVFRSDGTYKSTIKLQLAYPWAPSTLAAFSSGNLLISGLEYDHDTQNGAMWPFTAIFSSDGTMLKEIKLEDDEALRDMAVSGDSRVSSPTTPQANYAIEYGQTESAEDGNVYLMRWTTPAIFYAISPGGDVIRRFTVDPGDDRFRPSSMHIAGNRIAVLFFQPQSTEQRMKIVDLEGHDVATYDELWEKGKPTLGLAFACYTENPQRFTFLITGDDNRLNFQTAEVR